MKRGFTAVIFYLLTIGSSGTLDRARGNLLQGISGGPLTITGISLSGNTFTTGTAGTVGTATATMTGGSFTGTWSIQTSGTDHAAATCNNYGANFAINSSTGILTNTTGAAGGANAGLCIVATQAGAVASPFVQAETITGGACPQATTFIARTSGENSAALSAAICGLVTDGLIDSTATMASTGGNPYCGSTGKFNRLFILAMANSADGLLDVCGHTSNVSHGPPTFTANTGFLAPDMSTTVYLDTGFNPSTETDHFAQNSAHVMTWALTDNQSNGTDLGAFNSTATSATYLNAWGAGFFHAPINEDATLSGDVNNPSTTALGSFAVNRSGPGATTDIQLYRNGASTAFVGGQVSTAVAAFNLYLLNSNHAGAASGGSGRQIAVASIGASLTAAQISSSGGTTGTGLIPRLCAYLTTVHGSC